LANRTIKWIRPEADLKIEIIRRHTADPRSFPPLQPDVLPFCNPLWDLHVENPVAQHDVARVIDLRDAQQN
jgi:hypothetical protein